MNFPRWHLLTGLAVYYYIVFVERLRLYIKSTSAKDQVQSKPNEFGPEHSLFHKLRCQPKRIDRTGPRGRRSFWNNLN